MEREKNIFDTFIFVKTPTSILQTWRVGPGFRRKELCFRCNLQEATCARQVFPEDLMPKLLQASVLKPTLLHLI